MNQIAAQQQTQYFGECYPPSFNDRFTDSDKERNSLGIPRIEKETNLLIRNSKATNIRIRFN